MFFAIADDGVGKRRVDAGHAGQLPRRARVDVDARIAGARREHPGRQLDGGDSLGEFCRHYRSIVVSAITT